MRSKTTWDNFDRPTDPPESYDDELLGRIDPTRTARCAMCDGMYNERDPEQARDHEHPEPQSGKLRLDFIRSRMPYDKWALETHYGGLWLEYVSKQHYISPTNRRLIRAVRRSSG